MTPLEYKAVYENLEVLRKDGKPDTVKVAVDQYRRLDWGADGAERYAIYKRLLHDGVEKDTVLQLGTKQITVGRDIQQIKGQRWAMMSSLPFWGKGSPEQCQLVLQLADRLGTRAPRLAGLRQETRPGLQRIRRQLSLAAHALGLDGTW